MSEHESVDQRMVSSIPPDLGESVIQGKNYVFPDEESICFASINCIFDTTEQTRIFLSVAVVSEHESVDWRMVSSIPPDIGESVIQGENYIVNNHTVSPLMLINLDQNSIKQISNPGLVETLSPLGMARSYMSSAR